ncbi:MAG TPA: DUF433 domain-containing protein [Chloroflexota bacterium]|nr:DUF433 domain-containing protein [Chloroflexota bacterium]
MDQILESYPHLTREQIQAAINFAKTVVNATRSIGPIEPLDQASA